jgi:hypothetical protein
MEFLMEAAKKIAPDVRFDGRHGLVLRDDSAEHRLFNPTLEAMLQRYLQFPQHRLDVREWVEETKPDPLFGFVALCEYLDLDADYVRRGLTRWMDKIDHGALPGRELHARDWPGFDRHLSMPERKKSRFA